MKPNNPPEDPANTTPTATATMVSNSNATTSSSNLASTSAKDPEAAPPGAATNDAHSKKTTNDSYEEKPDLKYFVSDGAMKSLKESRVQHNNSNKRMNKASEHSGTTSSAGSSLWGGVWKSGRRLYGSVVSVASSITLTEFGEFSEEELEEEFGVRSETSLDIHQLSAANHNSHSNNNDSKPIQPQRQESVSVLCVQSSSMAAVEQHTSSSNNDITADQNSHNGSGSGSVQPPFRRVKSLDQSPILPGRKTSLTNSSRNLAEKTGKEMLALRSKQDISPQQRYPNRKKSSHTSQLQETEMIMSEWREQAYALRELIDFETQKSIDNNGDDTDESTTKKTSMRTFRGTPTVDRMVETKLVSTREEAVQVAQRLREELGLFYALGDPSHCNSIGDDDDDKDNDNEPLILFQDTNDTIYVWCDDNPFLEHSDSDFQQLPKPIVSTPMPLPRISMGSGGNTKTTTKTQKIDRPPIYSVRRTTDTSISIEEDASLNEEKAKRLSVPKVRSATSY